MNSLEKRPIKKDLQEKINAFDRYLQQKVALNPKMLGKITNIWEGLFQFSDKEKFKDFLKNELHLGRFFLSSIPHLVVVLSEEKTREEIKAGKMTPEEIKKRTFGEDLHAIATNRLLHHAISLGSDPNEIFSGDLFAVLTGKKSVHSAVGFAIQKNQYNAVKTIFDLGGRIDCQSNGYYPIHHAFSEFEGAIDKHNNTQKRLDTYAKLNRTSIQKLIIDRMKNVGLKTMKRENVLHIIARSGEKIEPSVFLKLIEKGASLNSKDLNGDTPVHIAASVGNVWFLKMIKNHSPNLGVFNNQGFTPLHIAALADQVDCFEALAKMGSSIQKRDMRGNVALHYFENQKNLFKKSGAKKEFLETDRNESAEIDKSKKRIGQLQFIGMNQQKNRGDNAEKKKAIFEKYKEKENPMDALIKSMLQDF